MGTDITEVPNLPFAVVQDGVLRKEAIDRINAFIEDAVKGRGTNWRQIILEEKPPSVLQAWVCNLTFMKQSVLLASIRGPDGLHKNHVAKAILRWYRRCILNCAFDKRVHTTPEDQCTGKFTGNLPKRFQSIDEAVAEYHTSLDEVPHHFQLHLMHASEILGYKHPDHAIRLWWRSFYFSLAKDMHLTPETEEQMDYRLGDSPAQWREGEVVTAEE
jgi:hypothetical protein